MSWGRFSDKWVVDKVLFEFVNQGGCSCCGFRHAGMEVSDFMALCSDVNTDDGKKEQLSPWPKFMHDDIWADRVKFRRILKQRKEEFSKMFAFSKNALSQLATLDDEDVKPSVPSPSHEPDEFLHWWLHEADETTRRRCFILPREDLFEMLRNQFDFGAAYNTLLCSVVEQLQNFSQTNFPSDGESAFEAFFEDCLGYYKGAFVVRKPLFTSAEGDQSFLYFLNHLTSSSNLPKCSKKETTIENDDLAEDPKEPEGQSFRSDRRLIRLLILRFYAEQAWNKFQKWKTQIKAVDAKENVTVNK